MTETFSGVVTSDGKKRSFLTDDTLTKSGVPADSKAVGDRFAKAEEATSELKDDKVDKPTANDDGKIPRANNGDVEWVEVGQPTDEQTNSAVTKWLDDHPEATTTVQDGAITEAKINNSFLPWIRNEYITPQMFGAKADGVTDDTNALQNTFNYAIDNKVYVYIPSGTYLFDVLTFPLNQDGMIIRGCGKWKTTLKCMNNNSQIFFSDFLRYDISEICFEGKDTATIPFIELNGVSHLSIFHDCIFRTNYGVLVHNSGYLSFYDCSFAVLDTHPCKYLLSVKGEYFYLRNCYFEGKHINLESTGIILTNCAEIYINDSDICNFYGGTGLLIKPQNNSAYDIYINNTTLMRCKTCIDLNCSYPINNINVNINVYDEAIMNKIITLHRDDGKNGILNGINGNINVRGQLNTDIDLIDGNLYYGDNKIYINNYTNDILKYRNSSPVFPIFRKNSLSNSLIVIQ